MNAMQINIDVSFFSVGCGDAVHVRFFGDDLQHHNIIIDGGTELGNIYESTLRPALIQIRERKESIDLWVVTHIDDDHIGGLLRFIREQDLLDKIDISRTIFWFNSSPWDYEPFGSNSELKSVKQGIRLRDFLNKTSRVEQAITTTTAPLNLHGLTLTILSPSNDRLQSSLAKWDGEERKIRTRSRYTAKSATSHDYKTRIDEFNLSNFSPDRSVENQSSIALLIEHRQRRIMLTADSDPAQLAASLRGLGCSTESKLRLDLMQLPHHGSKHNLNDELISLIECEHFVVSADAYNRHNLPNKEALARLFSKVSTQAILFITHENKLTSTIFSVDDSYRRPTLKFPERGSNKINFQY